MDTTILVDKHYDEGKKLIEKLDEDGKKYPIALWMNEDNSNDWTLVFGIPNLNSTGMIVHLKYLQNVLLKNNLDLSLSNISLADTKSDICKELRSTIKTGPGIKKIPFFGHYINTHRFPDSIIYRVN